MLFKLRNIIWSLNIQSPLYLIFIIQLHILFHRVEVSPWVYAMILSFRGSLTQCITLARDEQIQGLGH